MAITKKSYPQAKDAKSLHPSGFTGSQFRNRPDKKEFGRMEQENVRRASRLEGKAKNAGLRSTKKPSKKG